MRRRLSSRCSWGHESEPPKIASKWAPPTGRGGRRPDKLSGSRDAAAATGAVEVERARVLTHRRRRRGMRRHAGTTPRTRRRARTTGAQALQALRRYGTQKSPPLTPLLRPNGKHSQRPGGLIERN
ncbi:unnamed protein product, partial [Iphiclides podalirius]